MAKHGVDFSLAEDFDWETAHIEQGSHSEYGEARSVAFGWIDNRLYVLVFVRRGHVLRIIGLRKANQREGGDMKTRKPDHIAQEDWDAVDIPELTEEDFARMRPASEVVPEIVAEYRRSRGRPPSEKKKVLLSVRYSQEVVDYFRSTGEGWQTRMDAVLKEWIEQHH